MAVKAGGVGVLISNITMWTIYTRNNDEGRGGGEPSKIRGLEGGIAQK